MKPYWRSTRTFTRRHLWRGDPPPMGKVKTLCNHDPADHAELTLDEHKPKCKNCLKMENHP